MDSRVAKSVCSTCGAKPRSNMAHMGMISSLYEYNNDNNVSGGYYSRPSWFVRRV